MPQNKTSETAPQFIPKDLVFKEDYSFTKRDAEHEFSTRMHYHDFYEVQFYVKKGDPHIGTLLINGETRELSQGCLVLINMFVPHQIKITTKEPYLRYCISFDSSLLLFASSEKSNLYNIFSNCAENPEYSKPLTKYQIDRFDTLYRKHEGVALAHGADLLEKSLIIEILAYVYDIFYDNREISSTDSRNMALLTDLLKYIDDHLKYDLSLDVLASEVNFSTFYLTRMFRKYTGTTLNKYIVNKRIEKAKLMIDSDVPINDVSLEVGFNNYTHFYRTFRKLTGVNPSDYKKAHAAKNA